jgi:hypothetical protein
MNIQALPISIKTLVVITDLDTGKELVRGANAIHQENMSDAIAKMLSRNTSFFISEMHFGNGASITAADGTISYRAPNISGANANLHKGAYFRVVDDADLNNPDPAVNNVVVSHSNGTTYSDIVITATLDYADPESTDSVFNIVNSTQESLDATTSVSGEFVFDEICLKTRGTSGVNTGNLLTHFIFHPVEKLANQRIQVVYTLRVQAG